MNSILTKEADNIRLNSDETAVLILDQTQLPNETVYLELNELEASYQAIKQLQVRGAPAIGIFAAYALAVLAKQIKATTFSDFYAAFKHNADYLNSARPTAVNLSWAVKRLENGVLARKAQALSEIVVWLITESKKIQAEDIAMCYAISENGLSLLKDGWGILTHCNAGPLATSCYGTALGPLLLGHEQGYKFHVFADETRPLLQGARLTSYELDKADIDVTLICDNMASIVMKNGWIQACLVGCDRVSANGDVANKIGTSGVAILAKHYNIPFYVLGPSSTIDFTCETGADIKIELRDPDEIKNMFYAKPMAPAEVKCYNPAFDVTDNELITAIITERGIVRQPYRENLAKLFPELQTNS